MSTISLILEPDADGNLRLPLPGEPRRGKVKIVATVEAVAVAEESDISARTRAVAALEHGAFPRE
ncbi:MAG: hypothetical protein HY719_05910 [Planctomycetes bacterium]|nr:hypothetical protein [Planctomycetota bacterium]